MKLNLTKSTAMFLILGEAGSGKTHFAASTGMKTFYVLTEKQGMETLRICQAAGMIHPESIFELIEDWQSWENLIMSATFQSVIKSFDLFVLDTIDDLDERIGASLAIRAGVTALEEIDDYGRTRATAKARLQTHVLNPIRSLPCDVVILGHISEKEILVDKQRTIKTSLRISGKQEEVLAQKFNCIFLLQKVEFNGKIKRQIVTRSKSDVLTKDHPAFADKEEANLTTILNKFRNYGNKTIDKIIEATKEPVVITDTGIQISTEVRIPPPRAEKKPESLLDMMPTPPSNAAEMERMKNDPEYRRTFEQFGEPHSADPIIPPAAPSPPTATPVKRRRII